MSLEQNKLASFGPINTNSVLMEKVKALVNAAKGVMPMLYAHGMGETLSKAIQDLEKEFASQREVC